MPSTTRPRRPQTRRTQTSTPTARFARSGRAATRPARPTMPRRRQQPKKATGLGGLLGSLPFGKSTPTSSGGRGKKAGGLALLTAAAGFAVSNRDKIGSLLHRNQQPEAATPMPAPTTRPTEPSGP